MRDNCFLDIAGNEVRLSDIENIVFDYGGVIVDLDRDSVARQLKEIGMKDVEEYLSSYHQKGVFDLLERGVIGAGEFRNEIRLLSDSDVSDEVIDSIWKSFLVGIDEDKLRLINELKKSHNIYLLSNTNPIHWKYSSEKLLLSDEYSVDSLFTNTYRSFVIGIAKPDVRIYQYMIDDAKLNVEKTMFIDDSMLNCRVAQDLGIHSFFTADGKDWLELFANKK